MAPVQVQELALDEIFTAVRDGQAEGRHSPVFSTVLQEAQYGAILHIEVSEGTKTNLAIVESKFHRVAHHNPKLITGDGEPSYPGAVAHVFPDAEFIQDLVHKVRNVRKKKPVKRQLEAAVETYRATLTATWQTRLQQDRIIFTEYLDQAYQDYEATPALEDACQTAWANYHAWEAREATALTEEIEERAGTFRQCLHRHLYCSQAAARVAREKAGETGPESKLRTTCRLEGFNRALRARERRPLCYRAKRSIYAVQGLLLLQHNMVGSGQGNLYDLLGVPKPETRWNPFAAFPPRWKSEQTLAAPQGTPLREVTTRYRHQHSHELDLPLRLEWSPRREEVEVNAPEVRVQG